MNPGDGVAQDALGLTSLRAAVMEANALAGDDVIQLAPGASILSLSGPDSDATHDIDIRSNVSIEATGSGSTSIVGSGSGRVFHVHSGASLTLTGVEVSGGNTDDSGGGVFNEGGTLELVNTTILASTAASGGAISNTGDATIFNSTISGNTGGGIHNESGALLIIQSSTVTNNTASAAAGIDNLGTARLFNTIVAGNIGTTANTDVAGAFISSGFNLIGNVGDGAGVSGFNLDDFLGEGSDPIDPRLDPLANNGGSSSTHALLPGSVAIDGGRTTTTDSSALDQRGGPRVLDGDGIHGATIDIGSFERVNDFNPDDPIPEEIQLGDITVRVSPIATGLVSPSQVFNAGDGSGRLFITDQFGFVHLIKDGTLQGTPFLDITDSIRDTLNGNDERGLSGFAFHPEFAEMGTPGYGKFYTWVDELVDEGQPVDFTHFPLEPGVERAAQTVLREWTMNDIDDDVFAGTSREVMRIDQPHQAHSAGHAAFGPDDLLYLSLGDGGTHDDQGPGHIPDTGNSRVLNNVYGKMLRIDPMGNNSANGKYGIPATNPFVGDADALDEIFFYGLRNPFRFSFERDELGNKTTKVVIGDTGQDDIEEVDRADIVTDIGGNFGWNLKEGTFLFDAGPPPGPGGELRIGVTADSPGSPLGLIDPVVQYDHGPNGEGTAVIGGYLYQGDQIPELKGKYIFGDFNEKFSGPFIPNGRVFYTDFEAENPEILELDLEGALLSGGGGLGMYIKGFGIDEAGEMYVVGSTTLASGDNSGVIVKLRPATGVVAGVVVTPTAGLETSEDGGQAQFDIVLSSPPTHSVSIVVASSDTNEGTVSTNNVTFTPANWDTPQTVTVTGVDDSVVDGPVQYLVRLGPITSNDLEYAGIDPDDVSIFNLDNDVDPYSFTVEIGAVRDNTLFESDTGALSNGAGQYLFAGTTGDDDLRRTLLAFELAGAIPDDATITGASLQLNMSRTIAGSTDVSLHSVNFDWGEGDSDAGGQEGSGVAAASGDATWLHRFSDTTFWTTPGGDFDTAVSATTAVGGDGTYTWSSGQFVDDVRSWKFRPSGTVSWAVIGDESQASTAKRFDSRESPTEETRPVLTITYSTPPIVADGNLDGKVDGLDYLIWAIHFGDDPAQDPPGSPANGDYHENGVVDEFDYLTWAAKFGTSKSSVATPNVAVQPTSLAGEDLGAVDTALEDDYDKGATVADDPVVRQWQLSRAFDSVLKKTRGKRAARK